MKNLQFWKTVDESGLTSWESVRLNHFRPILQEQPIPGQIIPIPEIWGSHFGSATFRGRKIERTKKILIYEKTTTTDGRTWFETIIFWRRFHLFIDSFQKLAMFPHKSSVFRSQSCETVSELLGVILSEAIIHGLLLFRPKLQRKSIVHRISQNTKFSRTLIMNIGNPSPLRIFLPEHESACEKWEIYISAMLLYDVLYLPLVKFNLVACDWNACMEWASDIKRETINQLGVSLHSCNGMLFACDKFCFDVRFHSRLLDSSFTFFPSSMPHISLEFAFIKCYTQGKLGRFSIKTGWEKMADKYSIAHTSSRNDRIKTATAFEKRGNERENRNRQEREREINSQMENQLHFSRIQGFVLSTEYTDFYGRGLYYIKPETWKNAIHQMEQTHNRRACANISPLKSPHTILSQSAHFLVNISYCLTPKTRTVQLPTK